MLHNPMRRSFTEILRQESPISLAREAIWRSGRGWHKKRFQAQVKSVSCPVQLRHISYYASGVPTLSEASKALITSYADEICRGRFPFLGYGTWDLGLEPKWNVDFVSGIEWPPVTIKDNDCIRVDGSDAKVPFELSRLQFLPILGKAFVITSDERYRDHAKHLLSDWIMKNPVGVGVNWSIAMEAALRAMSICFMLNLLSPLRPAEEQSWLPRVIQSLWHHMLFIEAHIEFSHLISSNHYLSNVLGLYCLSEFLDGPGMAAKRRLYRQRVETELLRQVYEDGGDYEASTGYHVLVTQMFTSGLLLIRASNTVPKPHFIERLRRMYLMIEHLAGPSCQLPNVGDCDDGRVELLLDDIGQMLAVPVHERNSLRVSTLLGIGSHLFGGRDGSMEDAIWYRRDKVEDAASSECVHTSLTRQNIVVFPHSGIGTARTDDAEILFFAMRNGILGKGSHTHNDKLSFVLRLDGEEVFCDSGTNTYTRNPEMRNRFRATSAHNTVVIDGKEQNIIDGSRSGLFWMGTEAQVSPIEQANDSEELVLRASHSGYERFGVTHIRTIRLRTGKNSAVIEDQLVGDGTLPFEINFHLTPKWKVSSVETLESEVRVRVSGTRELRIVFQGPNDVLGQREESSVSMTYGASAPNDRLRFWGKSTFPTTLTTTISWAALEVGNATKTGGYS